MNKETESKTLSQIKEYSARIKNDHIRVNAKIKKKNILQLDEVNAVKATVLLELDFKFLRLGTLPNENPQTKAITDKDKGSLLVECPSVVVSK